MKWPDHWCQSVVEPLVYFAFLFFNETAITKTQGLVVVIWTHNYIVDLSFNLWFTVSNQEKVKDYTWVETQLNSVLGHINIILIIFIIRIYLYTGPCRCWRSQDCKGWHIPKTGSWICSSPPELCIRWWKERFLWHCCADTEIRHYIQLILCPARVSALQG